MVPNLFFSHRMDALVDRLVEQLDANPARPLQTRTVLVPNGQMKQWLLLEIAKRKGIAMGLKAASIEEMLPKPSSVEIFCQTYDLLRESADPGLHAYLEGKKGRLLKLTAELTSLFFLYGQYGKELFEESPIDWQQAILQKLFVQGPRRMPVQTLSESKPGPIICFGIDDLPPPLWDFLFRSPSLSLYLFSPCADFWDDLCSDKERRHLYRLWKKRKTTEASREQLDAYLRDAPPLLANWGKLGRETLKILDRFEWQAEEVYPPLEADSLLKKVQSSLLHFQTHPKEVDNSIQVFLTGSSRLKEIECLREEILRLKIPYHEISVLAPNIEPYVPLIEFVFKDIPYRISGFDIAPQSSFRQGLVRILHLACGRWAAEDLLALFETAAFYRKQGWDGDTLDAFRKWIEYARIKWGLDASHKNQVLAETIGKTADGAGSWEQGLDRLLDAIVYLVPLQIDPDELEKFIDLIQQLTKLSLRGEKTLAAWADSLEQIANEFLLANLEDEADAAAYGSFSHFLRSLRECGGESLFPCAVIQRLLARPAFGQIHASHLHAVRFMPLEEGALLPARALFLIGMDEESFPHVKIGSSLDLLKRQGVAVPDPADRDRYLFLEALFSAQEFLRISYGHLSADEGKPVGASLIVQELMHAVGLSGSVYRTPPSLPSPKTSSFWPSFNKGPLPEGEVVVSLSDLRLLARHPWKFFLQKVHGMYLNEQLDDSFALQKGQLLRATLEKPVAQVLEEAELPPGLLGEAVRLEIVEKAAEWQVQMAEWQLEPFSLIFRENCTQIQWEGSYCIAPPIELCWDELKVRLVGEIKQTTRKGLICANDDNVSGLLKIWPEALAAAIALNAPQIWMLKNGKTKTIERAEEGLKAFVAYYFQCLAVPSPLLTDWADAILRKGVDELEKKMKMGSQFDDPVVDWVLARAEMPAAAEIMTGWGAYLRGAFCHLSALYPSRSKSHGIV